MPLSLGQLWRYPVKSMAGERVDRATLTDLGVPGDRLVWGPRPRGECARPGGNTSCWACAPR
jgi:uncharacterized protein YcbX